MPVSSQIRTKIQAPSGRRWYALHTRSNFEKPLRAELVAKGIEVFLPTYQQVHQWKDRKKTLEMPVFSGYVFVRIVNCEDDIQRVLRSHGAVRLLGSGAALDPVPDAEIDGIRKLLESKLPFSPQPCLHTGDRVRVKTGPLRHVEGSFVRVNENQGKLVLAVEMLSRAVAVEVELRDIEVLRPASYYRTKMIA